MISASPVICSRRWGGKRVPHSRQPDGPQYRQWDIERAREWAGRIGENTTIVVNRIFESVPVHEQDLGAALAGLRYPNAYLRRVDMLEQRGPHRGMIAQLGTCQFITRQRSIVFQGFTGSVSPTSGQRW